MQISDVVRSKGAAVHTVRPEESVARALELLAQHRIGALVVSPDGTAIAGIVSERDVVRRVHQDGREVLDGPVEAIMTREVITCQPAEQLEKLAETMTLHHIRHCPVVEDGRLVGIVTIGDVVKSRIDQLVAERDHLSAYIQQ